MYLCKYKEEIHGEINIPGDKSITHRGIMLGAIAKGNTYLHGFLDGEDCISTLSCFEKMGIESERKNDTLIIKGKGLYGLSSPNEVLYTGNSGTTTRLISGILVAQSFNSELSGDSSLNKRPMKRIITPLLMMGGDISSKNNDSLPPLIIKGKKLNPISYDSPVSSAQVKSCVLLAGLFTDGETSVTEPSLSRDHTERMIKAFGGFIKTSNNTASVSGNKDLFAQEINIPGDISSAAYFIAMALLSKRGELLIKNVNINETRAGLLKVIKMMGGNVSVLNKREVSNEDIADLLIKPSSLKGCTIDKDLIPSLIDEIPIISVLAAFSEGETIIKDASELRVKETDRIKTISTNLKALGCSVEENPDGMIIKGGESLHGGRVLSFNDHRIAMSFAVMGSKINDEVLIENEKCADISFPGFYEKLEAL